MTLQTEVVLKTQTEFVKWEGVLNEHRADRQVRKRQARRTEKERNRNQKSTLL